MIRHAARWCGALGAGALGLAIVVVALHALGQTRGAIQPGGRAAFDAVIYGLVLLVKGVWPLTTLAYFVRECLVRVFGPRAYGWLATAVTSLVCYAPVTLLLGISSDAFPGLRMRNEYEMAGTGALLAAGVTLTLRWIDHAIPPRRASAPRTAAGGAP